jgi:hypothetical protein
MRVCQVERKNNTWETITNDQQEKVWKGDENAIVVEIAAVAIIRRVVKKQSRDIVHAIVCCSLIHHGVVEQKVKSAKKAHPFVKEKIHNFQT